MCCIRCVNVEPLRKPAFTGLGLLVLATGTMAAHATGTIAGTKIESVATASYSAMGSERLSVRSAVSSFRVDEMLDVTVVNSDPGDILAAAGAEGAALGFDITNNGNGQEQFSLTTVTALGQDDFDPQAPSIYLDHNGNGVFEPAIDALYVPGANDPALGPDQTLRVFVLAAIPDEAQDGQNGRLDLQATAVTLSGTAGLSAAGAGDDGVFAVVGPSGATASSSGRYEASAAALAFTKTATILDASGSQSPAPHAIITFALRAVVTGSGKLDALVLTDPVPAGTSYVPNSIHLDGIAQSDAPDGDAATLADNIVTINLGSVPGGTTRLATFQVRIQ
jgi:uncharacterized repeat protein (TIGR01451 family)